MPKETKAFIRSCVEVIHTDNAKRRSLCMNEPRACMSSNVLQQVRAGMTFFTP